MSKHGKYKHGKYKHGKSNNMLIEIGYLLLLLSFNYIFLIFLIFLIFYLLIKKLYLFENFDTNSQAIRDTGSPDTSHNVDVPLSTTSSCKNMCGPPNRCSITGQQCFSDIDCPGCQPTISNIQTTVVDVSGNNEAGKLGAKLTYSTLTTDIGTQARIYTPNKFAKPAAPNIGTNTWSDKFNKDRKMFDDRYKPSGLKNMPSYSDRYSISGEFVDEGPIASNDYLT
jgi:hypothetical protein